MPATEFVARLDHLLQADGELIASAARYVAGTAPLKVIAKAARPFARQTAVAGKIRRRAAIAEHLDVLAVRGLGIIRLNDSLLRPALTRRTDALKVRILLLDPDCEAALRRAAEIHESATVFAAGIRLTIARLTEVAESEPGIDLEVGVYASLPIWRIIRIDSTAWVSCFDARWEGHESTVYEIPETSGGSLWAGYRRQFEDIYTNARRVV